MSHPRPMTGKAAARVLCGIPAVQREALVELTSARADARVRSPSPGTALTVTRARWTSPAHSRSRPGGAAMGNTAAEVLVRPINGLVATPRTREQEFTTEGR